MRTLQTEIEIAAPASVVWDILADFERYPHWNPFVRFIAGEQSTGAKLEVRLLQNEGGKPMTLRPSLITWAPGRELAWSGRLLLPGVMDAEHHFVIEPLVGEKVLFRQWERFGGLLVPFLGGMLERETRPAFERMNRALRERAEAAYLGFRASDR